MDNTKLALFRNKLIECGCTAMIIPTNDPHFGEYTQDHYKIREWLSGFTGSAGTLVITLEDAALWTDSRYFVQAEKELGGTGIRLMKLKMPGTPAIGEWIKGQYPKGGKVAIDKSLFSWCEYLSLEKSLFPCTVELVDDFVSSIWRERPALEFNKIEYLPESYSGEDTASKHKRVTETLEIGKKAFVYIVTACDEVAWLCNIRGCDIEYNPLPQSYAAVSDGAIHLFVNRESLSGEALSVLEKNGVVLHPYTGFEPFLQSVPAEAVRVCTFSKVTVRDYKALDKPGAVFLEDPVTGGTINHLKSVKNNTELSGFAKAFEADGIAWCKVLKYIHDSLAAGIALNEYSIGEKLIAFRKENPLYRGESFEPIVAFGAAASLPHYSATADNSRPVGTGNFLLMDTGGQYLCGTTDTTRTLPLGNLSDVQKRHYTLVLKGMIDLSLARFPKGTRGSQLDILARGPLFNDGLMFFHGTCHGIGHYLCVHEGPQSVRMEENPVTLRPGMVISNEPAIYFDGEYGIRIENVLVIEAWKNTVFNDFYGFRTLTLVPINTSCVQKELLTGQELQWLNTYNKHVYDTLSVHLDPQTAAWLKEVCKPLV